jgi:ABC-2 type transport system permease protein
MKRIWHISMIDIRLMVRDKIFFFWTLLFPMVFIFIFGNLYKEDGGQRLKANLIVVNKDLGQWGGYFVEKLKAPGIVLRTMEEEPERYTRILVIPADFSQKIEAKTAQELVFKTHERANFNAGKQVEIKIIQGIVRLITEMILHPDSATFFEQKKEFKDILEIKARFPEDTVLKRPTGFDHVIPGVMVQFILMMVFIYGGITVMTDRQRGTLSRIMFSSTSMSELWAGKFLGRLKMGIIQALILVVAGKLIFNLNLGNYFLAALIILVFAMSAAALSIFIGSVIKKEDLMIGVSILLANILSALGGTWWPIEVVPPSVRTVGMISPAYWAMDSFHQIIFFNKGFADILPNLTVLLVFTAVFTVLAIKFFKIKE